MSGTILSPVLNSTALDKVFDPCGNKLRLGTSTDAAVDFVSNILL